MRADVREYAPLPRFRLEKSSASDTGTSRAAFMFPPMQNFQRFLSVLLCPTFVWANVEAGERAHCLARLASRRRRCVSSQGYLSLLLKGAKGKEGTASHGEGGLDEQNNAN